MIKDSLIVVLTFILYIHLTSTINTHLSTALVSGFREGRWYVIEDEERKSLEVKINGYLERDNLYVSKSVVFVREKPDQRR